MVRAPGGRTGEAVLAMDPHAWQHGAERETVHSGVRLVLGGRKFSQGERDHGGGQGQQHRGQGERRGGGPEQVARLVELHADDAATRARDPRLLATALVVVATAASPASALAAGATDSVQRIHRLLGPGEPLGRARRHLLRGTAAALALTPVLLALTPAVVALALGKLPAA